jgi:hypothetical protein
MADQDIVIDYISSNPNELVCYDCGKAFQPNERRFTQIVLKVTDTTNECKALRMVHRDTCFVAIEQRRHQHVINHVRIPQRNRVEMSLTHQANMIERDHSLLFRMIMEYQGAQDVTATPADAQTDDVATASYELQSPLFDELRVNKDFYTREQFNQLFTRLHVHRLVATGKKEVSATALNSSIAARLRATAIPGCRLRVWTFMQTVKENECVLTLVIVIGLTELRLAPLWRLFQHDDTFTWAQLLPDMRMYPGLSPPNEAWSSARADAAADLLMGYNALVNAIQTHQPLLDGVSINCKTVLESKEAASVDMRYANQGRKMLVLSQACQTSSTEKDFYFIPAENSDGQQLIVASGKTYDPMPLYYTSTDKLEQQLLAANFKLKPLLLHKHMQVTHTQNKPKAC